MRPIRPAPIEGSDPPPAASRRTRYRITVLGVSRSTCSAWAEAVVVENGDGTTTITAAVDQAGLRGILCQLWDLNATLIAATWAPESSEHKGSGTKGSREDG